MMRPPTPRPLKIFVLLWFIILPVLLSLGCAYYNTFYNAEKFYRQAEKERLRSLEKEPSASLSALYDKAIQKASKLLLLHPKSKWVDDSLLLLGKAFYHKGEYPKAVRKFEELVAHYPQSELVEEARYFRGLCLGKMKSSAEAAEVFRRLATGDGKFSVDALLASAQMEIEQEQYLEAIETLQKGRKRVSAKAKLAQISYRMGECYLAVEEYAKAISSFQKALATDLDREMEFGAWFNIGQCLEKSGQSQEALSLYETLLKNKDYYSYSAKLILQIARIYELLGDFPRALEEYDRVASSYPETEHSASALYQAGLIYQSELDSLQIAKQYFDQVAKQSHYPDLAKLARFRGANTEKLEKYRASGQASPDTLLLLAELYLLQFAQPDSALAQYEKIIEQFPESPLAAKAAYGMGWTYKTSLRDSVRAAAAFRIMLERYPASRYTAAVRKELGLEDPGEEMFLQAERLRLDGARPELYLPQLERLVEQHPQSAYVPKAQYLVARTYEYVLGDSALARQVYEDLVRRFPDTQPGKIASQRLSFEKQDKEDSATQQKEDSAGATDENIPGTGESPLEP